MRIGNSLPGYSAVAAFVLWLTGLFLAGAPPKTSDPVSALTALLTDHRRELIAGTYLVGLGTLVFLIFLAAVGRHLRDDLASPDAASVATQGGLVTGVLLLLGAAVVAGAALGADRAIDPGIARMATDAGNATVALANLGIAALVGAVTAAKRGSATRSGWLERTGPPVVLLLLAGTAAPFLVDTGAWQFGGFAPIACLLPAIVWVVGLAFHLPNQDQEKP